MKRYFLLLTVLISLTIFAQDKVEYYPNGNIKAEYTLIDGKANGEVRTYNENGKLFNISNWENDIQHGQSTVFYESGEKFKVMSFKNGIQSDSMLVYYKNGQLMEVSTIKEGKKEGPFTEYYENGNLKSISNLKNGLYHGKCKFYNENGDIKKEGEMSYGAKIGSWMEYNEHGVTFAKYELSKPSLPDTLIIKDFILKDKFSINYPNSWEVSNHGSPSVLFLCSPMDGFGVFRDNLLVYVADLPQGTRNLVGFSKQMDNYMANKYPDYNLVNKVIADSKSEATMIYDFSNSDGRTLVELRAQAKFILDKKIVYQIIFTAERDRFDDRIKDVDMIMDSFKLID
jgi:antitoxin component YwqK of YwqJK toxin-antitoxin module